MRYLFSLVILLLLPIQAAAQLTGVTVDSTTIPAEDIDQVFVDQDTGELVITTTTGYEVKPVVVDGSVSITSFRVNSKSSLLLPTTGSTSVTWSTVNADACFASTTPSESLSGWNSSTVLANSGSKSVNFNEKGSFLLTLTCNGPTGDPVSSNVEVTVGQVAITSFTATPDHSPVEKGDDVSITLRWATENAVNCYGSWVSGSGKLGNTSGTNVRQFKDVSTAISFTLTCEGGIADNPVEKTVKVKVTAKQVATCDHVSLTNGLVKQWGGTGGVLRLNWPGPKSEIEPVVVPELGYLALEFNTGSDQATGQVAAIEFAGTNGARLGSISACAGDFDVPSECKYVWGIGGGIIWDTTGNQKGACMLDPDTTYYWNITFTSGVQPTGDPPTSRCTGTFCQTWLQVVNPEYK